MTAMNDEEFLSAVEALLPRIAERGRETELLRMVHPDTMAEFKEQGIMRGLQPKRWGGHEISPLTFLQAGIKVASACASTAWIFNVVGVHSWQLALFDERAQEEVWGEDQTVLMSSSYAPMGKAEPVEGGFNFSGRWQFSSGCDHCQWVCVGGMTVDKDGNPDLTTFVVPRSDYEIIDTWHTSGLCGTGSKDIVIDNVFVPTHRTLSFGQTFRGETPGTEKNDSWIYRVPFGQIFPFGVAVSAIGAAEGAYAVARDYLRKKVTIMGIGNVGADPFMQVRMAKAAAEITAARAELTTAWEPMIEHAKAGTPIPMDLRGRARWNQVNIVEHGVRAVDLIMEAGGGRSIYLDNPIQRFFRDVHAMKAHSTNNHEQGALLFGQPELAPDQPVMNNFI